MQDSVVEHLVCTQLSPSSPPAPVLGTAVHYPPNQVNFSHFPYIFPIENKNSIFFPAHLPTERLPPPVPGALPAPLLLPPASPVGIGRRCQPAEEDGLFIDDLFFFHFHFLLLKGILWAQDRRHAQEGGHPAEVVCDLQINIGLGFITGSWRRERLKVQFTARRTIPVTDSLTVGLTILETLAHFSWKMILLPLGSGMVNG